MAAKEIAWAIAVPLLSLKTSCANLEFRTTCPAETNRARSFFPGVTIYPAGNTPAENRSHPNHLVRCNPAKQVLESWPGLF
jgi:hypothetical protein